MTGRICTGITAMAATLALGAAPAFAETETFGSSQTRTPSTSGPCTGTADCVVFQSAPADGGTNTPTAAGQVTEISIAKDAGALNIQPVVVSGPLGRTPDYTIEAFGDTIALNAGPGTASYPLSTPLDIGPGDTVGIRYPDGAVPTSPQIFSDEAGNGGQATTLNGVTAPGTFPPASTLPDYDLLMRFAVETTSGPPGQPYDLVVETTGTEYLVDTCDGELCVSAPGVPANIPGIAFPWVSASVQNLGPATSEQTQGEMIFDGFGGEVRTTGPDECSLPLPSVTSCPIRPLAAGELLSPIDISWGELEFVDVNAFRARLPFEVGVLARVNCNQSREANCENNSSANTIRFTPVPQAKVKNAAKGGLEGTAKPPAGDAEIESTEVAVVKAGNGLDGFDGSASESQRRAKAKKCLWLKSKKAKFSKSPPNGKSCDEPVWLKAKGTEKWSYKLKKPLRSGKYVAYVRTTTSDGAVEFFFDDKDGNREEFKVKK